MPSPIDVTLRASGAAIASGVGASVDLLGVDGLVRRAVALMLECTALNVGLTCRVETSPSGSSWKEIGRFTALTAVGFERMTFCPVERYARVGWTLGTASTGATFQVVGQAEVVYADLGDFYRYGLPRQAIEGLEPLDTVVAALLSASTLAEEAIPSRYRATLPSPCPPILRQRVCEFAIGPVLGVRGYSLEDRADAEALKRYEYARDWFEKLASGTISPPWVPTEDPTTPAIVTGSYGVASDCPRGRF